MRCRKAFGIFANKFKDVGPHFPVMTWNYFHAGMFIRLNWNSKQEKSGIKHDKTKLSFIQGFA